MARLGLETHVVDPAALDRAVLHLRRACVVLPRIGELADPTRIPATVARALEGVAPDDAHPLNLYRVHWHNARDRRGRVEIPEHLVLPGELTGVDATIVVALGNRFPLIRAHKVLAAYGCLAPRIVTGQFDPTAHRALWPSTGNYCRGGVAISRIMGCRGIAILPAGMSAERFRWLEAWVASADDIVRTPGTESNVKEIYDECRRLGAVPGNVVLNQFSELGNHLFHRLVTGPAMERIFEAVAARRHGSRLAAFVAATGSAGTLGAAEHLRERHGTRTVAVEALECPTMLENGFGEHNIQGIGDKHVPLIHNVMGTDLVVAVSDAATDELGLLFSSDAGKSYLTERRRISPAAIEGLGDLGLSAICNVLASIETARTLRLGSDDVILTVATDGAEMYGSERERVLDHRFGGRFDDLDAAETFGRHVLGGRHERALEIGPAERRRIFNLGYYTWVEQQGVSVADFEARRSPSFWSELPAIGAAWDDRIESFNERTGALRAL